MIRITFICDYCGKHVNSAIIRPQRAVTTDPVADHINRDAEKIAFDPYFCCKDCLGVGELFEQRSELGISELEEALTFITHAHIAALTDLGYDPAIQPAVLRAHEALEKAMLERKR